MLTNEGNEFMVGYGNGTVGLAVNPPPISDGLTPIPYMDLSPEEAENLAQLLLSNAKMGRLMRADQHRSKSKNSRRI